MRLDKYPEKKTDLKIRNCIKNSDKSGKTMNKEREEEWLEKNKEAIEEQNKRIDKEGLFSDEHRRF